MDENFQLSVRPVRNRSQKPMKLPGGFTISEMLLVLGLFFLTSLFQIGVMGRVAIIGVFVAYIKLLKDQLPDNYVQQMIRFYVRKDHLYRAGGRDASWKPPVVFK